jgi:hypothetical protein
MSTFLLRLHEDILPAQAAPIHLPTAARSVYVVDGDVTVEMTDGGQHHAAGSAWVGQAPVTLLAGAEGARLWRWELLSLEQKADGALRCAPGVASNLKLSAELELDTAFDWLMRIDRVGFPPGGIAFTHVHQGPGIRCVLKGEISIQAEGKTDVHKVGEPWLERGHFPVLAPTTEASETEFIRCLILPRQCKGRSSIRYVLPEDADKPKRQRYHVFGERFIELP